MEILLTNRNDKYIMQYDKDGCQQDNYPCHMEVLYDIAKPFERTKSRTEC